MKLEKIPDELLKRHPDLVILSQGILPFPSRGEWDGVSAMVNGERILLDEPMREAMRKLLDAGYLTEPICIYETFADGSGRILLSCFGVPRKISAKGLSEIADWEREGCEVAGLGPELALIYTPAGKIERYRRRLSFDTLFEYTN